MTSPDTLNRIGILTRREIEARMLAPIITALCEKFDRAEVIGIIREQIIAMAHQQGSNLTGEFGGCGLAEFESSLEHWTKDDALRIDVVERTPEAFGFNVIKCRYAELYQRLGVPELGEILSCNRDYALIEGFNADIRLTRTQTIMQGASHCDFRYRHNPQSPNPDA
ncbi:MAG: L-2-amino-thiazoline-4-carboxylic acid hydrolase [Chloroflexales bacterium]|nr:L-2-amino-thiazoline-4-carboxylic acid hydrolase [Chloroflexales bacterium]